MKTTTVLATVELKIEDDMIYEREMLLQELQGEFVKIKSGLYENVASGWVVNAEFKPDNTEESN